jgi:hypothetical protein
MLQTKSHSEETREERSNPFEDPAQPQKVGRMGHYPLSSRIPDAVLGASAMPSYPKPRIDRA